MNGENFSEANDIIAWLILGYLCSHPDAKDTAEGAAHWWLSSEGIDVDAEDLRSSLDYLVQLGWLTATARHAGVIVYELSQNRRWDLRHFMQSHVIWH